MTLTELQSRFLGQAALANGLYLTVFGGAVWLWLRRDGVEMTPLTTLICAVPLLLAAVVTFTFGPDYTQNTLRLMASALLPPVLVLFWAGSAEPAAPAAAPRLVWPWALGFALLHAVVFAGSVLWLGTTGTRIPAEPGLPRVSAEVLEARLLSLNAGPMELAATAPGELVARFRYRAGEEGRSLWVILNIDNPAGHVRVRERQSADGARPGDESEAAMRRPGDRLLDPGRPQASRVYGTQAQVTTIDPARLRAIPVRLDDGRVEVAGQFLSGLDEKSMIALLCAVVTRSGWDWRPAFLGER